MRVQTWSLLNFIVNKKFNYCLMVLVVESTAVSSSSQLLASGQVSALTKVGTKYFCVFSL